MQVIDGTPTYVCLCAIFMHMCAIFIHICVQYIRNQGASANTIFDSSTYGCLPVMRLFYARLRTYAQYDAMNEFTCSEHSVKKKTRITGKQRL